MISLNDYLSLNRDIKHEGKIVVFTNGCFDLLHQGHLDLLKQAKALGDILVVGLNSDSSIKDLKGDNRPVESEIERSKKLMDTPWVDYVILFQEETPAKLIQSILPNVLVKGGDYQMNEIVGAKEVIHHGGIVEIIPLTPGFSTTKTIEKMNREELD